ncbi:hypothetical protein, partial [Microbispora rosea]
MGLAVWAEFVAGAVPVVEGAVVEVPVVEGAVVEGAVDGIPARASARRTMSAAVPEERPTRRAWPGPCGETVASSTSTAPASLSRPGRQPRGLSSSTS